MGKDPAEYTDKHPLSYDYKSWWGRPKGNIAYTWENHYFTWSIFQKEEFWNTYINDY